jgi:hypothetical protein
MVYWGLMDLKPARRPLLAWCGNCKTTFVAGTFGAGGMAVGGSTFGSNITYIGKMTSAPGGFDLSGSKTECPNCHHMADLPDGLYDTTCGVVRRGLQVLRSISSDEASALAEALQQRQRGEVDNEDVVAVAPDEAKPWLRQVLDDQWTPFLLSVILALVLYFKADAGNAVTERHIIHTEQQDLVHIHQLQQDETDMQRMVREMIERMEHDSPPRAQPPKLAVERRAGVRLRPSSPCWCGTATKYKHCHGKRR